MTIEIVTVEERFKEIRKNLKVVAEILAAFEAAYEDSISLEPERALNQVREAIKHNSLAYSDTGESTTEVDAMGIGFELRRVTMEDLRDLTDGR